MKFNYAIIGTGSSISNSYCFFSVAGSSREFSPPRNYDRYFSLPTGSSRSPIRNRSHERSLGNSPPRRRYNSRSPRRYSHDVEVILPPTSSSILDRLDDSLTFDLLDRLDDSLSFVQGSLVSRSRSLRRPQIRFTDAFRTSGSSWGFILEPRGANWTNHPN